MKNGPIYSNISIINRAFRALGSPLHRDLIIDFVRTHWGNGRGLPLEEAQNLVKLALEAQFYYEKASEEDHFSRKEVYCKELDRLYYNMQINPYPYQYNSRIMNLTMSEIYLDPRFDTISSDDGIIYLVLSEWNLLNDLVYYYMVKNNIDKIPISDIYRNVLSKYSIDDPNAYFFPKIDPRFQVNRKQIVSLVEKNYSEAFLSVQVTDYIKEKVAMKIPIIKQFVMDSKEAVKIRYIIKRIFNLQPHQPLFFPYFEAIKQIVPLLQNNLFLVNDDSLIYSASKELPKIIPKQRLYGSTNLDIIDLKVNELDYNINNQTTSLKQKDQTSHETTPLVKRQKLSYTLRYYDRIQETLAAHYFKDWIQNGYLKVNFLYGEKITPMIIHYDEKNNVLYGEHLSNFMIDYDLEPGQKLEFFLKDDHLYLELGVFDEKAHTEQMKYEDLAKLSEMKKLGTKSLMQHLAELLMLHPSGLHIREIVRDIQEDTTYAESSIRNTLSSFPFFEPIKGKVGYWRFNPKLWKKQYMELENNIKNNLKSKSIPTLRQQWKIKALASTKTKRRLTNEQFKQLPKETFLSLAWDYYSFTIYQYAKKFSCETVPMEDLYQEAYFALHKAYEKYNPELGGSFYYYFRRHLFARLQRYKSDNLSLIRIPTHRIETLMKNDQIFEKQLITNEKTNINILDSDYILFKTNYISFEELYSLYDDNVGDEARARIYCYFNHPFYEDTSLKRQVFIDYSYIEEPEECDWLLSEERYEEEIENRVLAESAIDYLRNIIKNPRDWKIILYRFGFMTGEEMTLQEIGELFGVSRERIRQIENKALKHLKKCPALKGANP
jgi:RNA polymerase primary sigma factor